MYESDRVAVEAFIARALEKKGARHSSTILSEPTPAQRRQYKDNHLSDFRRLCVTGADVFKNALSGEVEDLDSVHILGIEPVRIQTFNDGFSAEELEDEARAIYVRSNFPELAPRLVRQVVRHFEIEEN
jgi:hypothetical protein